MSACNPNGEHARRVEEISLKAAKTLALAAEIRGSHHCRHLDRVSFLAI